MQFLISALKTKVVLVPVNQPNEAITEAEAEAVDAWVRELNCGHRVAHDQWQLTDYKALVMFKLRWS